MGTLLGITGDGAEYERAGAEYEGGGVTAACGVGSGDGALDEGTGGAFCGEGLAAGA